MFRTSLSVILFGLIAQPPRTHAEELPAITLTGKREPIIRKIDKTVHDVSAMPKAANGTAQDVLQAIPGLSVSADGQVAVKGNAQVTIVVDGKPVAAMQGEERVATLQTMNGADIAGVEVITNPSAAYQANGGAIVNIVLKRNRKQGAHAQARGSVGDHGLWNAGVSGDMTSKHLSAHGNVAYRHDGTLKTRRSAVDWTDAGRGGQTLQTSQVFVRRVVDSAALGLDVTLSNTDSVSLSARHNTRRSRPWLDTLNVVRDEAGESVYHRVSHGPNEQSDDSATLDYSHQGKGTAFKASVQRSETTTLIDKSFDDVFVTPVRPTGTNHGVTRSTRRLDQATLDWSRSFDHHKLGVGLDLQEEVNKLHNYQAAVDRATGAETPNPDTTNGYAVTTTLAAAYLTNQLRRDKWEALLGGRIERMALRVHPAGGAARTSHWQAFNPSLHLKYAASEWVDLSLSYRRSLQRPDSRDLNPFSTYIDAQNLGRGSPALQPQRFAAWEIGTDITGGQLSGSLGAFHRDSHDMVAESRSIANGVIVTSKQNGGRARSTGITGSLDWAPGAKLKLGMDGSIHRVALDTQDLGATVRQRGISGYLNFRAAYRTAIDDVSLDAQRQSSGFTPLVRYGSTSSVNVAWKRQLTKALSLTVNATDLFDGSRRTYRTAPATSTDRFRQEGFDHFVARRIYIGFVMKTG